MGYQLWLRDESKQLKEYMSKENGGNMIQDKLAKIQTELNAPKNQRNNFGNYNYRSCEDILSALKPILNGCVILLSDEICMIGGRFYVKATATLRDGEESISTTAFAREANDKKGQDDAQITGSASSYARKYALNGLFAIDDTRDADDTNTHDKTTARPAQTPVSKPVESNPSKESIAEKPNRKCTLHDADMAHGVGKSGKEYWAHKNQDGEYCFGSGYMQRKAQQ